MSTAAKVAPKSLNQLRNFCYLTVAWLGFNKGFREKRENDALWVEHQRKVLAEHAEHKQQELALKQAAEAAKRGPSSVPEIVPQDLHELYKTVEKSIQ